MGTRKYALWISLLLVIAAIVVSVVAYPHLPATIPMHWDISGHPNGFGSRLTGAILLPAIMLAVWLVLIVVPHGDRALFIRYENRTSEEPTRLPVYDVIITICLALLLAIHIFAIGQADGWFVPRESPALFTVVLAIFIILLGNFSPRVTRRNAFIGARLPWAYASGEVWRRTQRISGYGLVAAGIVGLLAAAISPGVSMKILVGALVAQSLLVAIYSYRIAHSREVP